MMMNEQAKEEQEVLEAIFGVQNGEYPVGEFGRETLYFCISLPLPADYPAASPPTFLFKYPNLYPKSTLKQREWEKMLMETCSQQLEALFQPGNVCIFEWIDYLKSYVENHRGNWLPAISEEIERKTPREVNATSFRNFNLENCPEIHHSKEPLVEKRSVFIAHLAKVDSMKQLEAAQKCLLSDPKIAKATHNISAFRIKEDNGVMRQDSNDDGEDAAGNRLLHLLQLSNCSNVYIVVSRYYGGIQLGPLRFKCINNCARQLLVEQGFIKPDSLKKKNT